MALMAAKPLSNHTISSEKHRGVFQNNKMLNRFYNTFTINELISEAERLKFSKHYTTAAQVLRIAQEKMYKNKETRLEYLLKLPMYLQLCGQEYNGWMEFYRIKKALYSYEEENHITLSELIFYESKISASMAIFQERKGEYTSAIYFTIRSYIESLVTLHYVINAQKEKETEHQGTSLETIFYNFRQQGEQYLKLKKASFQIVSTLAVILHRIGEMNLLEPFFYLVKETIDSMPTIDYIHLEERCHSIFLENSFK